MRVKTKKSPRKARPSLAKGQIWKTKDAHVEIVDLGKVLVHYRMVRNLKTSRKTQMSRIESMEDYLKANKARLLEDVSRN